MLQGKADSRSLQSDSAAMSPERGPWSRALATVELTLENKIMNREHIKYPCRSVQKRKLLLNMNQCILIMNLTLTLLFTHVEDLKVKWETEESHIFLFFFFFLINKQWTDEHHSHNFNTCWCQYNKLTLCNVLVRQVCVTPEREWNGKLDQPLIQKSPQFVLRFCFWYNWKDLKSFH